MAYIRPWMSRPGRIFLRKLHGNVSDENKKSFHPWSPHLVPEITDIITGEYSNQDQIHSVKALEYIGFCM